MKPRLLIVSYTNPGSDPRVARQVRFLSEDFDLTVVGLPPGPDGVDFIPVGKRGGAWRKMGWAAALLIGHDRPFMSRYRLEDAGLNGRKFDLILVNDADPLPLAFSLAGEEVPVFFDAHEYYPRIEESWRWIMLFRRHYRRLCREYIPRCAGMSTVGKIIAAEYERRFGRLPAVVRNVPEAQVLEPQPVSGKIRLIHHGLGKPSRHLEQMIAMMELVDPRFSLDFMLTGDEGYLRELKAMAAGNDRIGFPPPVAMPEICGFINRYDLGVYLLPPVNFNQANALPNKFFEFIQARLGVVVGPSPEMAGIVREYDLGVVAEDFSPEAVAVAINRLTPERIAGFKARAHDAAARFHAAAEMDGMRRALLAALAGGSD